MPLIRITTEPLQKACRPGHHTHWFKFNWLGWRWSIVLQVMLRCTQSWEELLTVCTNHLGILLKRRSWGEARDLIFLISRQEMCVLLVVHSSHFINKTLWCLVFDSCLRRLSVLKIIKLSFLLYFLLILFMIFKEIITAFGLIFLII